MKKIEFTGHVNADGTLELGKVQTDLTESDVNIFIMIQPKQEQVSEDLGWPPGFLNKFYGCLADSPIDEPEELVFEVRELIE